MQKDIKLQPKRFPGPNIGPDSYNFLDKIVPWLENKNIKVINKTFSLFSIISKAETV